MKTESSIRARAGWYSRRVAAVLAVLFCVRDAAFARSPSEWEGEQGPLHSLFSENPELKPIRLIRAQDYFQVGAALTASPEHGYRWERWALQPDGKPIERMAASGKIGSRRLIDLNSGETIGIFDCSDAPATVKLINRYGRRIDLDLSMIRPGEAEAQSPYPLYRVKDRDRRGQPLEVDPNPIGWIDEFQGTLTDEKDAPVARFEPARLTEVGVRTDLHRFVFEGRSLSTELMTGTPSHDLLRRIEEHALALKGSTVLPTKLLRIELAARWLQAGAALVKDTSATITLPPERIIAVRRALGAASLVDLNFLWKEPTRRLLWDALAAAHPYYHFYAEGAGLAELRDDPEVLEHTLRLLKAVWIKAGGQQISVTRAGPFEESMRAGLMDAMSFQAVRSPEQALGFSPECKVLAPSRLVRSRAPGDPPVLRTDPAALLRAANQLSAMDRAIHLAAALQRGGRDVTLWSLSVEKTIDAATKTVVQEPLIVFPKEPGKPEVQVLGGDYFLSPLQGRKLGVGHYEFPALSALQPLLMRSAQFQVSLVGVLEGQAGLEAWTRGIQNSLATIRPDDPMLASILLEGQGADSWEPFNAKATESLATLAQARFALLVRENNILVRIERVQEGKIVETVLVRNFDTRPADEILPKHEAVIGRCFQMLPRGMEEGIRSVTLRTEPILEPLPSAVIEDGKITVDNRDRLVIGRAGPTGFMLAAPRFPEAYHELMHRWGNSRIDRFEVGGWKGTLVEAFNEISWQRKENEPGWERRTSQFKIEDFWWDYGATNEREDFAVIGQFYGSQPGATRKRVREELKKGNFTPAVKYLYFKEVAFMDSDGRSLEIDLDEADTSFTNDEFEKAVRARERSSGLSHEQERLRDLARRFKSLQGLLKEKKTSRFIDPALTTPQGGPVPSLSRLPF